MTEKGEKVKIHAPNEGFTGKVAGVAFAAGVGEIDAENEDRIDYFRRKGYGVGGSPEKEQQAENNQKGSEKPLEEMSNAELDELGKGYAVVGITSMKQAEKIEAIREAKQDSVKE